MIHKGLELTKDEGYPAVKSLLKDNYDEGVDAIEDAEIKAVDLGKRSFGFIVNLPPSSKSVEKNLFLKIQIPFHSSRSEELERKEAEMQQKTFEFMEFAHDKFSVPQVLRGRNGGFVSHIAQNSEIPNDLQGYEFVLMTQVQGQALPLSKEGQAALQEFVRAQPGKNPGNLYLNDANYSGQDIQRMASNIAKMHKVGAQFLEQNNVPRNPTSGLRSSNEVYVGLNQAFGFDVVGVPEIELPSKISELKKSIEQKASNAMSVILPGRSGSTQELLEEAKKQFLSGIPEGQQDKYGSFSFGLEVAIRENELSEEQIKFGRQIQQIDDLLLFAKEDKIEKTVKMARDNFETYRAVENLPQTVLHNDTNATNFLFDRKSGQMTLIDYDTLGRGPRVADLLVHHIGNDKITKAAISAYDEKNPLTEEEQIFGPHYTACLTFDKLVEAIQNFCATEEINDSQHLNSLGWGIVDSSYGAYQNAEKWNEKEKVDLEKITSETRAEMSSRVKTMEALDLAVSKGQADKDYAAIKTSGGKVFGEEKPEKMVAAVKKTWVEKMENRAGAGKATGRNEEGSSL